MIAPLGSLGPGYLSRMATKERKLWFNSFSGIFAYISISVLRNLPFGPAKTQTAHKLMSQVCLLLSLLFAQLTKLVSSLLPIFFPTATLLFLPLPLARTTHC